MKETREIDLNTLVALRTEDERVFADTHALVLHWLGEGVLDGVRIDHVPTPDLHLNAPTRDGIATVYGEISLCLRFNHLWTRNFRGKYEKGIPHQ